MVASRNRLAGLRSQRGASLPLSLFLFMICAILASVVLSASSTVSGRQSQLIETDQRYYSVASTAKLMEKAFAEPVEFELVTTKETTRFLNDAQKPVQSTEFSSLQVISRARDKLEPVNGDLLSDFTLEEQVALYMLLGSKPASDDDLISKALKIPNNPIGDENNEEIPLVGDGEEGYKIEHDENAPSPTKGTLDVNLKKVVVQNDKTLMLELSSSAPSGASDASTTDYSLTLFLEPDVAVQVIPDENPLIETSSDNKTEKITETTTTRIEVNWSPLYILKAGA